MLAGEYGKNNRNCLTRSRTVPTKRPGPPKKSRLQRKLRTVELLQARKPKAIPAPPVELSWLQRAFIAILSCLGLRKQS